MKRPWSATLRATRSYQTASSPKCRCELNVMTYTTRNTKPVAQIPTSPRTTGSGRRIRSIEMLTPASRAPQVGVGVRVAGLGSRTRNRSAGPEKKPCGEGSRPDDEGDESQGRRNRGRPLGVLPEEDRPVVSHCVAALRLCERGALRQHDERAA